VLHWDRKAVLITYEAAVVDKGGPNDRDFS
jgi:hypothetical protein